MNHSVSSLFPLPLTVSLTRGWQTSSLPLASCVPDPKAKSESNEANLMKCEGSIEYPVSLGLTFSHSLTFPAHSQLFLRQTESRSSVPLVCVSACMCLPVCVYARLCLRVKRVFALAVVLWSFFFSFLFSFLRQRRHFIHLLRLSFQGSEGRERECVPSDSLTRIRDPLLT